MAETLNTPNPASPASSAAETARGRKPSNVVERSVADTAKEVAYRVDPINFQARVKDLYKLGDTASVAVSLVAKRALSLWNKAQKPNYQKFADQSAEISADFKNAIENNDPGARDSALLSQMELGQKHAADIAKNNALTARADFAGKLTTDGVNFLAQLFIAKTSNEVEQEKLMKVYEKTVAQELGHTAITRDDLKKSVNPIIKNSVDYYERKGKYRMIPVWAGLIMVVPLAADLMSRALKPVMGEKAESISKAFEWMKSFSGVDASLGSMAGYYGWYFSKRQKGAFYELDDIWDQTEGILTAENRSINRGVNPGTLVTSEKITKLYDEVAKEQDLPSFEVTDPLTNRIFDQVARYLNHQYMPLLYRVKKPDAEMHEELAGSHFTHADLVTLFGNKAIDINDAYATAVRLETLARKGVDEYRHVNEQLAQVIRPEKDRFANDQQFGVALENYLSQLDAIAERTLGEAWPARYIENEIRPNIPKSYGIEPILRPPEQRFAPPDRAAPLAHDAAVAPDGPTRTVPSYAEGQNEAQELRAKLDQSMDERKKDFATRIAPQPNRALNGTQTHAERAEATQGTSVIAL